MNGLWQLELRAVVASWELGIGYGGAAAANWSIRPGYPHTVDFDTTLDSPNAKGNIVLLRLCRHRLCLEHLWRLGLLALLDLGVLSKPHAVILQLEQAQHNGGNLLPLAESSKVLDVKSYNAAGQHLEGKSVQVQLQSVHPVESTYKSHLLP